MTAASRNNARSVTGPDTEFTILESARGVPTGEIQCDDCLAVGHGISGISHAPGCGQADVR